MLLTLTFETYHQRSLLAGSALTFSQMLFITLQQLPSFMAWRPSAGLLPRLKPRQVPLSQWLLQVVVLATGSLFNNWVYAFHVPLTIQIVFRSAGMDPLSVSFGHFLRQRFRTGGFHALWPLFHA